MIGQTMLGRGFRVKSTCCTLSQEQVSVPSPVRSASTSSSDVEVFNEEYHWVFPFFEQSEMISDDTTHETSDVREGIATYVEHKEIQDTGKASKNILGNTTQDTYLADFLARPVKVVSFTWNESDTVGVKGSYAIWSDWMNRTSITNKVANYAYFRGDLKIKVQISASPFYYGMMQMSYLPLPAFKSSTIYVDAANQWLIPKSQRPHVLIDPSQGDTFEFTAPFIYPYNMVDLTSLTAVTDMGTLDFDIYSVLRSANGVTGSGISVSVYCWLENAELSGATVGFTLQSDEYGVGVVSRPASWLSDFATHFENLPVIGTFATATRLGASAVSAIASLFGFTNVPVITDTEPMRPECFPKMASPEISFPVEKLTMDPKNELSVDPAIVGIDSSIDEMSIASVAQKESYLTTVNWATADSVDTIKFTTLVDPCIGGATTITGASLVYNTPLAFAAVPFTFWRGDIKIILRVIASKYHKGKLRISFDPSGTSGSNLQNVASTVNTVQTAIMDIGENREVEFTIPYQQRMQFLKLSGSTSNWTTSASPALTHLADTDNGYFTVRVQNALTAPVGTSSVDILVYIKGGDNIEFSSPDTIDDSHKFSYFAPQSDEYVSTPINGKVVMGSVKHSTDQQYLVHFGENVKSFRQLLHRYSRLSQEYQAAVATANSYQWFSKVVTRMPMFPGYISTGYGTASKQATGTYGYNFVEFIPLTYLANAYLCHRGSINYTFNVSGNIPSKTLIAERLVGTTASLASTATVVTTLSGLMRASLTGTGSKGMALTNQLTQAGLNVQFPFFLKERFATTNPSSGNVDTVSGAEVLRLRGEFPFPTTTQSDNTLITTYVATGPDYGLHFFLNVPTLYSYDTFPAAA